jgi:hypothetical protein
MPQIGGLEGKIRHLRGQRTATGWLRLYKSLYPGLEGLSAGAFPPGLLSRDDFLYELVGVRGAHALRMGQGGVRGAYGEEYEANDPA